MDTDGEKLNDLKYNIPFQYLAMNVVKQNLCSLEEADRKLEKKREILRYIIHAFLDEYQ